MQRYYPKNILVGIALLFCIAVQTRATDCGVTCSNMMYNSGHCDGTAPFCEGKCGSSPKSMSAYWMNGKSPVVCPGDCSDGNSCSSGYHKKCTCYQHTSNCGQTCENYPVLENGNILVSSWTSESVPYGYDSSTARTPAASLNGLTPNYCWCLYQPPLPWQNITGDWIEKQTANGYAGISMELTVGTSSTDSTATTESWSKSFTTAVSSGFSFEGVSGSVSISGTVAEQTATTVTSATTHTMEQSCTVDCPSPASLKMGYNYLGVWQWVMDGYQKGEKTTTVQSCTFFCIYSASSEPIPPKCPPTDCAASDNFCQTCLPSTDDVLISVQNGKHTYSKRFPKSVIKSNNHQKSDNHNLRV